MKKLAVSMVVAVGLLYIVILFMSSSRPGQAQPNSLLSPIVRLVQDGKTFCSGTVINNHTILTAAHCVIVQTFLGPGLRETVEIRSVSNDPIGVIGAVYYASPQMDQGLIKGDFHLFNSQPYISNIDKIVEQQVSGKHLIACGYPLRGGFYCSDLFFTRRENFAMMVIGILLPGMSGGPAMLMDGTVIGVNVAVENEESMISPIYNIDVEIQK